MCRDIVKDVQNSLAKVQDCRKKDSVVIMDVGDVRGEKEVSYIDLILNSLIPSYKDILQKIPLQDF